MVEEAVCSIEIVENGSGYRAKVQSAMGRYFEFEGDDLEYLMETIYEDIQMEVEKAFY
ncbi:MAG: hypothetical protein R6U61_06910 [Thermoplasmata archaeon]